MGTIGLLTGYLIAGEALLLSIGIVGTRRQGLAAAGLAIVSGWAFTALWLSLGLVVGVNPALPSALVAWALLLVVAVIVARRRPRRGGDWNVIRETRQAGRLIAAAGAAVLFVSLLALLVRTWEPTGVLHADVWNQWLPKAKILYYFGGLDTGPGGFTSQYNPDYPPLNAASEALAFHALGSTDVLDLARLHFALVASFVFGVAAILAPRVRPAILWPTLALLTLSPGFGRLVGSSLADEPLAMLVALGSLTGVVWLLDEDVAHVVLAGLFLAAATMTKNEGLMLALIVVVSLAATRKGRSHPHTLIALGGSILAVHGVWRLWLARHAVPQNPFYNVSDVLHPGFLALRIDRLHYALTELVGQFVTPSRWLLLVPATLILALLAVRRSPTLAIFTTSIIVLDTLGFASIYWLSRVDLHVYVDNTVDRLPAFIAVFCGSVLPLLLGVTQPNQWVTRPPIDTVEAGSHDSS
jgi:hypothetical protein